MEARSLHTHLVVEQERFLANNLGILGLEGSSSYCRHGPSWHKSQRRAAHADACMHACRIYVWYWLSNILKKQTPLAGHAKLHLVGPPRN